MKTRTQRPPFEQDQPLFHEVGSSFDLESLSDEEIEAMLFEEERQESSGFLNLPTVAGLSLILVGIMYIFQEMGVWNGFDLSVMVGMLPWLAGILIILLGFGVLSWRPTRRPKKKVRKGVDMQTGKKVVVEQKSKPKRKTKLMRSREKKIAGVCAGIAEYFGLDPTLVRIAFVVGTIASGGPFLLAYIALVFIMPKPETLSLEERITIIRDT